MGLRNDQCRWGGGDAWPLVGLRRSIGCLAVRIARFTITDEPTNGIVEALRVRRPSASSRATRSIAGSPPRDSACRWPTYACSAPVSRGASVCIGKNYADHPRRGRGGPGRAADLHKPNTSVIGPDDGIVYPSL